MTAAKKAASAKLEAADEATEDKSSGYTVVAPRISVVFGSQVLQFAAGDVLPGGANEDSIEHLLGLGFIAEN